MVDPQYIAKQLRIDSTSWHRVTLPFPDSDGNDIWIIANPGDSKPPKSTGELIPDLGFGMTTVYEVAHDAVTKGYAVDRFLLGRGGRTDARA